MIELFDEQRFRVKVSAPPALVENADLLRLFKSAVSAQADVLFTDNQPRIRCVRGSTSEQ